MSDEESWRPLTLRTRSAKPGRRGRSTMKIQRGWGGAAAVEAIGDGDGVTEARRR